MRRLFVTFLILSLFAVACGDDSNNDATSTTTTSTTTTSTTTTTTTTLPPRPDFPTPAASNVADLFALERPIVAGHAGGDQSWPHSTMYAFHQAAVAGADVLEMDVQLTGDGVLVIVHDDTVDRTTNGTGRVRDLTLAELQALDSGYWWSTEWGTFDLPDDAYIYRGVRTGDTAAPEGYGPDDFRIETFESVALAFPDHVLDVEIKVPSGDDGEIDLDFAIEGARALADEIERLDRTDSVIVVSFNDDVVEAFHDFAPDVVTSPGTASLTAWFVQQVPLLESHKILQVPPQFDDLDVLTIPGFLDKVKAEGLELWVWPNEAATQENADFYEELLDFGIDGVIAGRPAEAVDRYRDLGLIP